MSPTIGPGPGRTWAPVGDEPTNELPSGFQNHYNGRDTWTDTAAVVLLPIGGFLLAIWVGGLVFLWPFAAVGWIGGIAFLWLSDVWSVRDKIAGTLVVPACFALVLLPLGIAISVGDGVSGPVGAAILLVVLGIGLIATSAHLGRKLRRARQARA